MFLFSALTKFFTASNALHRAILDHDEKEFVRLIKQKVNLNNYYIGCTPLQLGLTQQMPRCVLLLLENGADPNAVCNSTYAPGKTLQFHVNGHAVSNVKLLALYGANADGISFTQPTQYLKQLILDKNSIYLRRKKLEQLATQEKNIPALIKIYEELQKLWSKESEGEVESAYKAHYEQKAAACQQKIIEITAIAATDADEKNNASVAEQELTPLLDQSSSNPSKFKLL